MHIFDWQTNSLFFMVVLIDKLLTERSIAMPYVNIKLAGEVTREQKAQIAKEITETLERVAHKPKSYTYITFEEVAYEDWAIAGQLLDE